MAKKTILIVDDSQFVRNYHAQILAPGFDVITAVDGMDGLEKLYSHSCDLILTDINMGHMDGYEFIRCVRAEPKYEDLPIIVISTEADPSDRMKGFEAGANLYIVKPCDPSMMMENIRAALAGR
jgi:two-component system chemotaxis response regulator CheY